MNKAVVLSCFAFFFAGAARGVTLPMDGSNYEVRRSSAARTPFAEKAAVRLDWPLEKLAKLERRGFGRTEMVSFVAIARKTEKTWEELVKEREAGASLRLMAEKVGLDYNKLFEESSRTKKEIEASLKEEPPPLETGKKGR